ncbi:DeoR/GlpR family DNA-binding transcription regulator [Leucobacter rhizosphaerae]|uniref:DeoR/GlpR family DNA-binding transcription regulator n=1 Tax=Leucobacter rhizosphaerae TaxID=2932245 RepID=A0ABY4FW20_9MICO|nr:DeoR/GlpR family DNA-binding transcription regulator [Leucobacter rhizosphaerae]UOQ60478.1 DeoR/GlpR family DNA-binding transcription regulator [Leucobacter rhizosphaerae]
MVVNSTFDTERRRDSMTERLTRDGSLLVNDAAGEWGVHPMTVRRDFEYFVDQGIAKRVRGGIIALRGDSFRHRRHLNATAKDAIAMKMLDLVESDSVIALDSSTTISVFAERLTKLRGVTVITNGLPAFEALRGRDGIQVFLTGGEQEVQNDSLVGPLAEAALSHFLIGTAFVSTMSLDPGVGAGENTLAQVSYKRALAARSGRLVLAIDASKLGTQARFRSFDFSEIDVLVTDLGPSDPRLDPYRDLVGEIR